MKWIETLWVPLEALDDFPGNPRTHDEDTLDAIASGLGQAHSLSVRPKGEGRWEIVGGHGFRDALARTGAQRVLIESWEMDDDEAVAAVLALNKGSDGAGYVETSLTALLQRVDEAGMLEATGFDAAELDDLIARAQEEALPWLAAGSPDLAAAIEAAAGPVAAAPGPLPVAPTDVASLPHLYGDSQEGQSSGVRSTPTMDAYAQRYAEKGTRALVMDFPNEQFAWLIEQLAILRGQYAVESNAELLIALVAEKAQPPADPEA